MTQTFLPFTRPATNEADIAAVVDVLRSGWITTGPKSQQLEQHFCDAFGGRHAVSVCSATAGMHVTLLALGIGPGDEVITPSQTWVSTANLIVLLGAKPVFVDVDRDTLMMDAAAAEAAITPCTKAIIPVHYAGAPVDLDPIYELAARHGLAVIEDAAHANGTQYKDRWIGAKGTAIFSLHAIKNVTSAEGGLIATDDDSLAERVQRLKFHGLGADAFDRVQQGRKPQAEVIEPGFKYNLADMNAALALSQMQRLAEINARRGELVALYREKLSGSPLQPLDCPTYPHHHSWHLFIVRVDPATCGIDRDTFMQKMQQQGIGTGIHFRGIHTQKYYRDHYPNLSLPNTEWNTARLCTLPLFPDMKNEDVERVVQASWDVLNGKETSL